MVALVEFRGKGVFLFVALAAVAAVSVLAFQPGGPGAGANAVAAGPSKAKPRVIKKMFNQRYCEILAVSPPTDLGFPVTIYNTIGLNDCPPAIWNSLDFSAIAAGEGLLAAAPNGPRRWLVDAVVGGRPGPLKELGGLQMREVARLTTTSLAPEPFTITTVNRDNNWVFRRGRTIHEVIAPGGRRFVMQAYTNTVDPGLNLKTLRYTASNPAAAIPRGWRFRSRKLRRPLVVKARGKARIVRDGLRSVYQRYTLPRIRKR